MREIKFRAWVGEPGDGRMCTMGFSISGNGTILDRNGRSVRVDGVMQFTGLLDKNGKEIYEGDIFQFHYNDGPGGRGVVFWHDEMAAYMWHPADHDESMSTLMPEYQVMEVIGNIYETPELINV